MTRISVPRILVIGAFGQVGTDLMPALRGRYGAEQVVGAGRHAPTNRADGPSERVDATDKNALRKVIERHRINTIYHLAAIMSARGEEDPAEAWRLNVTSLLNVLELGVEYNLQRIFFPSSIAVFGASAPKEKTPQHTVLEPTTMYGVTKVTGENLCHYFFRKFQLDVRSVRYPGLISYTTLPGGGTSDYAVEIFREAVKQRLYTCFVGPETRMPMMYMDDAIKATLDLMEADADSLTVRTSYNLGALSFSAMELAEEVARVIPGFVCDYAPDFRQSIADSWPNSIDDSVARRDWNWAPDYDMGRLSEAMFAGLRKSSMAP